MLEVDEPSIVHVYVQSVFQPPEVDSFDPFTSLDTHVRVQIVLVRHSVINKLHLCKSNLCIFFFYYNHYYNCYDHKNISALLMISLQRA